MFVPMRDWTVPAAVQPAPYCAKVTVRREPSQSAARHLRFQGLTSHAPSRWGPHMVRSTRDVSEAGHYKRGGFAFQTRAVAGESRNPPGQCASSTGSGLEQCSPQLSGVGAWCAGGGSLSIQKQSLAFTARDPCGPAKSFGGRPAHVSPTCAQPDQRPCQSSPISR